MDIRDFKNKVFAKAKENGFSEYEIYYYKADNFGVNVYSGEVDKYSVSNTIGVSFRGILNGKMGYSYTEILDEAAVEFLVESAKDSALTIENEDKEFIYSGKDTYFELDAYNKTLKEIGADNKIQLALKLEKEAKEKDEKVVNIGYCGVGSADMEYGLMNSSGIELFHKYNYAFGAVSPVVTDGERKYDGFSYRISNDFNEINSEIIAEEAVKEALDFIGGAPVNSGDYKIVLRNDISASLLATFSGAFSADNAQKGLSLLKGRVGEQIASTIVNVVDNPHLKNGLASSHFDAEGVATYKKNVIDNGTLKTLLYNLRTAAKDGVKTTGNASKGSIASPVGISPSNFYIENGVVDFNSMLESVGNGLYITELAGLHSGANGVTGDFSLAAKGFIIENGKISRPVEQITVAGNYFKLLGDIELIADDLKFSLGGGNANYGSPSVFVKNLAVAGI